MITWTNTTVKLGELKPWEHNPKSISKAHAKRLLASWENFGQFQTVAIGPGLEVYDGHQRLSVLRAAYGDAYAVDARQSSRALTDDERRQLVVEAHAGTTGQFDWDALANWDAAELQEWGLDGEALKDWKAGIGALTEMIEAGEESDNEPAEIEPDRFEAVAEKWGTCDGQLWKLGEHFILCGDSLDKDNIKRLMGDDVPALIIADPPYGVNIVASNGYVGGGEAYNIPFGGRKSRGTDGASKPFGSKAERGSDGAAHVVEVGKYPVVIGDEDTKTAERAVTLYRELYPKAIQVWWGANYYSPVLPASMCWLVWNKETTGNFADCELAWTNQDRAAKLFTHRWNGMLRDSERERRWHPTQKPAALAAWTYGEFTDTDEIILDPFAGAGWSILGGEQSGRKVRAIEKSHEYIAVILERWSIETGGTPELIDPDIQAGTGNGGQ